jgi:hypothetical protein
MTIRLYATYATVLVAVLSGFPAAAQTPNSSGPAITSSRSTVGSVIGTVTLRAADGQLAAMPGVTVTLTCGNDQAWTEVSNEEGEYRFDNVPVGDCSMVASMDGAASDAKAITVASDQVTEASLALALQQVSQEVTVTASAEGTEKNPIASEVERVSDKTLETAPIAKDRFQDALPLIPGVVRGPDGLLNIGGTRSNQAAMRLSHTLGHDPVTGEDAANLPIDAVSNVQVQRIAFAPEFGLSAGAVTSVEMRQGGDRWHAVINDLEPRIRIRDGHVRGIESFTPRVTIGGPIVASKLNVLESLQYEYSQTQVFDLPPLQSDTKEQSFESYTRLDWMPDASNHITGSVTASPRKTTYAGLNPFNPQPVTPEIEKHDLFVTVSDQIVTGKSGVIDAWASVKRFTTTVDPTEGSGAMILAPNVNSGSYFNEQDRSARRLEFVTSYSFMPFGPAHLVKAAIGFGSEDSDGYSRSQPVDIVRADGTLSERISFVGDGTLKRGRAGVAGYIQDAWRVSPRVNTQYGVRYTYESLTDRFAVEPRGQFTALLSPNGRTVFRGGAGLFDSLVPLNVGSFGQMQERTITDFMADGVTPIGPTTLQQNIQTSGPRWPRSLNWTAELDREWLKNLLVRFAFQERTTRHESFLDVPTSAEADPVLLLRSDGRSHYREEQIVARYQFHGSDQIIASYTHSSAIGDLNEFNSYFGDLQNPVIRPDERAPLPWDAPNRFLTWSTVSLPRGITIFPVLDVRTGFPLSIMDENRNFVGPRNRAGRYPEFVSVDMQVTKRLRLLGHNATVGLKVFNLTNHFNPRDFQGNLASDDFGGFRNSVGRSIRGKWVFEF